MHDKPAEMPARASAIEIARTLFKRGMSIGQARKILLELGYAAEISDTNPPELHVASKEVGSVPSGDFRTFPSVRWSDQ